MDMIKLECFCTVVRTQNYYTAAEELNMTQSSVSKHILQMEKELGVQLLNRNTNHTRRVTLTPAGEEIYRDAGRILETWRDIQEKLAAWRKESRIQIGCVNHLQKVGGMAPIISFMKEYPDIPLAMEENGTNELLAQLQKKEIDIAIIAHIYGDFSPEGNLQNFPVKGFRRLCMARDDYSLAVNKEHPLAAYKQADWKDLAGEKLIILDKSFSSNHIIREALAFYHCPVEIAFETNGVDNIWGMILENYGVSLLSHKVIRQMQGVVPVRMKSPIHRDTVMLVPEKTTAAVRKFADFVEGLL